MNTVARLTLWLELMLDEIARKEDDARRAEEEQALREAAAPTSAPAVAVAQAQLPAPISTSTPTRQEKAARRARSSQGT